MSSERRLRGHRDDPPVALSQWQLAVKTALDRVFAPAGGILSLPIVLLISLWIKIDSRGPILFKQKRVGRHGRAFTMYKFRTMVVDAEQLLDTDEELRNRHAQDFKLGGDDPRITRVGRVLRKLSLDELPNIINVMKGEMAFVGPRALVPAEIEKYYAGLEERLLAVKPGITGHWQVSGRSAVGYPARVELELWYASNFSLWTDVKILLRTVAVVLSTRGAG